MNIKPKISIISVNYNGFDLTCRMIESIGAHITTPCEIIVVDNGSRRDEAVMIAERYPQVKAIRSDENLGFAGGNNIGIRRAEGEYILLLNNDTEVEDDSLQWLCDALASDATLGAVCPKIKFFDAPRSVQYAGSTPLSCITLRNCQIGFNMPDDGSFDTPCTTPYAHGAAMMLRREVVDKVGLMPEIYFLYYEELDWSVRIAECGYRIGYEPRCTVFHKESATTGVQSPLKIFYITRNRLLFGWRNRQGAARYATLAYQMLIAAPKNIALAAIRGRLDLVWATMRGVVGFFGINNKMA